MVTKKKSTTKEKTKTIKKKVAKKPLKPRVKKPTKKRLMAISKAKWQTRKTDIFALTLIGVMLASVVVAGALMMKIFALQVENLQLNNTTEDTLTLLNQARVRLQDAEDIIREKSQQEDGQTSLIRSLRRQINDMPNEDEKMAVLQSMVMNATEVAGTLKKLSSTDKHLLAKYSKVYFLNEHYEPQNIKHIPKRWSRKPLQLRGEVVIALEKMFKQMANNGLSPQAVSGYRSFAYQKALKQKYKTKFGSGANTFSADQGFSEHQLGTTVDIAHFVDAIELFDKTGEYAWMQKHAYKYGFILSYPQSNTHYTFEPWHWRFVGIALATRLHNENKHFYDLSQREINKYLLNMFE